MTALVVHGGAGHVTPDRHDRLRAGVRAAAAAGHAILEAGGSALDAVVAGVRVLEDDPEYNAGTGSALTRDGTVETDAAVMDGESGRVGAVGAVPDLGCAIALARAVLDDGEHVLLVGPAAWRFAEGVGIAPAPAGSLIVPRMQARLDAWRQQRGVGGHGGLGGTVGAVARDATGRFAAATSTGGIVGKRSGRVGDSPIAGAGTWADERCALSATGDGEAIVRCALAHAIACRGGSLPDAMAAALCTLRTRTGGSAGVIGIDAHGVAFAQLSPTMPVAWITSDGAGDGLGRALASG